MANVAEQALNLPRIAFPAALHRRDVMPSVGREAERTAFDTQICRHPMDGMRRLGDLLVVAY